LDEWGYSDGLSAAGINSYSTEEAKYTDLEGTWPSYSEEETDIDVDHGGGNSCALVPPSLRGSIRKCSSGKYLHIGLSSNVKGAILCLDHLTMMVHEE
jgi:hypothetical protein